VKANQKVDSSKPDHLRHGDTVPYLELRSLNKVVVVAGQLQDSKQAHLPFPVHGIGMHVGACHRFLLVRPSPGPPGRRLFLLTAVQVLRCDHPAPLSLPV
jgi:hypothetical protein